MRRLSINSVKCGLDRGREPRPRTYWIGNGLYTDGNVASMLENLGQPREALPHHLLNLQVKERLDDGSNSSRAEIAVGRNKVAVALYKLGDLRQALEYFRREHQIYSELTARDPKDMRWKQKFATNMAYLGRARSGQCRFGAAWPSPRGMLPKRGPRSRKQ